MDIYEAALKAQLVNVEARRKAAAGYIYNKSMIIETKLLTKQADALREALNTHLEQTQDI